MTDIEDSYFKIAIVGTVSSGKSSVINAILGQELLPTENTATTTAITRIDHQKDCKRFSTIAYGSHENEVLSVDQFLYSNQIANAKQLKALNSRDDIDYIHIKTNVLNVKSKGKNISFYDSPGINNGHDKSGVKLTHTLLNSKLDLIIYVLNVSQLATNDDAIFLNNLYQQVRNKNKKILFVLNKIDLLDVEKGEILEGVIDRVNTYLINIGFNKPKIIPVSARWALLARQKIQGFSLTECENFLLESTLLNISKSGFEYVTKNIDKEYLTLFKDIHSSNPNNNHSLNDSLSDGMIFDLLNKSGIRILEYLLESYSS